MWPTDAWMGLAAIVAIVVTTVAALLVARTRWRRRGLPPGDRSERRAPSRLGLDQETPPEADAREPRLPRLPPPPGAPREPAPGNLLPKSTHADGNDTAPWDRPTPPLLPRAGPRSPVVLVHGLLGFESFAGREYFRGVAEQLRRMGVTVHTVRVAPMASVQTRAHQLAAQIQALGDERVNVVAHSMGGLDARYAIARLGLSERVASLTTVGTPHRGTPLADAGALFVPGPALRPVLGRMGTDVSVVHDLSMRRMARFNERVADVGGVDYTSYAAGSAHARGVNAMLLPSFLVLRTLAGDNDGMVPTRSQRWGEVLGEIEADHWAQIGWAPGFDAEGFYASVVRELRGRGH